MCATQKCSRSWSRARYKRPMTRLRLPCLLVGLGILCSGVSACGAGVTIVTHGFNSTADTWVFNLATAIASHPSFPGTNLTCYELTVSNTTGGLQVTPRLAAGTSPATSDTAEIFIKLDWGPVSGTANAYSTRDVAAAVVPKLMDTNFLPQLAGHSLAELPLHLIGHSRGGSLIAEMARLLGREGVWVDQLTLLDPHPLNNDGNSDTILPSIVDASASVYVNVLFAENFWQDMNIYPHGRATAGAYNRKLTSLGGGYTDFFSGSHSDVHLWYFGTVGLGTPVFDGEVNLTASERSSWWSSFEAAGTNAGYRYSRLANGDRLTTAEPAGSGLGRIRDGMNKAWDFGAGVTNNRIAIGTNSLSWPNVIRLNLNGPAQLAPGLCSAVRFFHQGGAIGSSNLTLSVHLDADRNPWNSNSVEVTNAALVGTGSSNVFQTVINFAAPMTNPVAGTYSVFAKISDGTRARFFYAPETVTLASAIPSLAPLQFAGGNFHFRLIAAGGQRIAIEGSPDFVTWQPLWSNVLAQATNDYMVASPEGHRFFRAICLPLPTP